MNISCKVLKPINNLCGCDQIWPHWKKMVLIYSFFFLTGSCWYRTELFIQIDFTNCFIGRKTHTLFKETKIFIFEIDTHPSTTTNVAKKSKTLNVSLTSHKLGIAFEILLIPKSSLEFRVLSNYPPCLQSRNNTSGILTETSNRTSSKVQRCKSEEKQPLQK